MSINEYYSVKNECVNEIVIDHSRFIGQTKKVDTEEEAKAFISLIKKKHSLATHNCYAYVADEKSNVVKFSDDGEPQGTAGMPILEVLKNKKLCKTVVVVTRYFGGIKLGAGGLVRAYSKCASLVLEQAKIIKNVLCNRYKFNLTYEQYPKFLQFFANLSDVKIDKSEFSNQVDLEILIASASSTSVLEKLNDYFLGKLDYSKISEEYYVF